MARSSCNGGGSIDPYFDGGITGTNMNMFYSPFKSHINEAISKLIILTISNRNIHQRIFRESDECLTASFGVILRVVYEEVVGKPPVPNKHITSQIQELEAKVRAQVYARADKIEVNVCKSEIYDLTMGRVLKKSEIFRLIGLLENPIKDIFSDSGFQGYTVAYGLGVKFISPEGKPVGFSLYRQYFARTAAQNIHYETENYEDAPIAHEIFNSLYEEQIEKGILGSFTSSKDAPTSLLEELVLDFYLANGIKIDVHPKEYLESYEAKADGVSIAGAFNTGGRYVQAFMTKKIGYNEAKLIVKTLNLLPKHLLKDVKTIKKKQDDALNLDGIIKGVVTLGYYTARTKKITMCASAEAPFNTHSEAYRYVYITTLLHETGESVWANLDQEKRDEFASISGWKSKEFGDYGHSVAKSDLRGHFLSHYSHASAPNDDFSEHFAFYVFHAEEFRAAALTSPAIKRKYEFIKSLFTSNEKAKEYPQISRMSIEEVNGKIEQEIKKHSMAEATFLDEIRIRKMEDDFKETKKNIKLNLEGEETETEINNRAVQEFLKNR